MMKNMFCMTTIMWILLSIFSLPGFSQEMKVKNGHFSFGDAVTLESTILEETRSLFISCPPGYEAGSGDYPLLYVLDGDGRFPYAASLVQFLSNAGRIPEFIVVAIANGPGRNARDRDMTPGDSPGEPEGSANFQLFMKNELFPFIEQKYRTQPFRVLYGHSLAGLFTFYTLFTTPDLFNAYIASSPSIVHKEEITLKILTETLDKWTAANGMNAAGLEKFLYITVGDEPRYVPAIEKVVSLLNEKKVKNLNWHYIKLKGEHHRSMPLKSLYNGLETIFADYDMPSPFEIGTMEIEDLRKNLDGFSKTYGFKIRIPEMIGNFLGYMAMQQDNIEKALEVFNFNVEMYPASPNAYDSLGECLEKKGNNEGARRNFEKAASLAEKSNHPMLEAIKKNLQRINEKKSN